MHDLGTPAPSPTAPTPEEDPGVSLWVLGVTIVVALGMAVALAWVVLGQESAEPAGPAHPDRWDRRVAPFVKVVEKQRGLEFRHPVAVRFLPDAQFEETVSVDEQLTEAERRDLATVTGTLRALGLLRGDVDLLGAMSKANQAGILAHYSFEDQQITVRGKKLTPAIRSTLVHELTHALQDQHFTIGNRLDGLLQANQDGTDSTAASVLRAVIEGDAMRVEELYKSRLSARQRAALDAERAQENARARRGLARVPTFVQTMLTAPYQLGSGLVGTVAEDGGNASVDDLLRTPPSHESALLDPLGHTLAGNQARPVPLPTVTEGEKKLDAGEFGTFSWYLVLAERLPVQDALDASDAWAGDTYLAYEAGGRTCVRLGVRGGSRGAADLIHEAMRRWAASTPRTTRVSRQGNVPQLQSCDPGPRAPGGNEASPRAVDLVSARTGVAIGLLRAKVPAYRARCLAVGLTRSYSVEQLSNPSFGADPSVQGRVQQLAADCG